MGQKLEFPSEGGPVPGYLARPDPPAAHGRAVVVIQEWWGLNAQIQRTADRFAQAGFFAVAPDLYRGTVTKSPDEAGKLLMALDVERADRDLRGAVDQASALAGGRPVGVAGFCMGGALSLFTACRNGARVRACVVFYGGHPKVTYDLDALEAPVLGHWAERDPFANAVRDAVGPELRRRGKAHEFHTYPGTQHAFFNEDRPQVYAPEAATLAWARTVAFLEAHL